MYATRPARVLFIVAAMLVLVVFVAGSAHAGPITNGLQLWLDATDETTFTFDPAGSNFVEQWRDKSGNNHHANAGTMKPIWESNVLPVPNPIGGQPAVLFSRTTGDSTALDIDGDFGIGVNDRRTAFMVMKYTTADATSDSNFILGTNLQNVVNVGKVKTVSGTEQMRLRFVNLTEDSPEGSVPGDEDTVLTVRSEQGTAQATLAYNNGYEIIDSGAYAFHWSIGSNLQVGGANWDDLAYQGYIAEVLLYDRALNNSELYNVGTYLEQKYDITSLHRGIGGDGPYGIPEPSALLLAVVGLLCAACGRRGKRRV